MKKYEYISYGFLLALVFFAGNFAIAAERVIIEGVLEQIAADNITIKPKNASSTIININEKTKYIDKFGKVLSISIFSAGDEIRIEGEKKSKKSKTITAKEARDISSFKSSAEKLGKVKQITGENEFILKMLNRPETEYAVKVIPGTKIRQNRKDAAFSALIPGGPKIHLSGVLNEKNKVITASRIIINSENGEDKKEEKKDKKVKKNFTLYGALEQVAADSITIKPKNASSTIINTNGDTKFERKFGGKINISELTLGDELMVKGKRNIDNPEVLTAKEVKDISIFKMKTTKDGIIQGVSGNVVILKTRDGKKDEEYSVKTADETKIKNNGKKIRTQDLEIGQKITVSGIMNVNTKTISANKIIVRKSKINPVLLDGVVESIDVQNSKFVFVYSGEKSTVKITIGTKITASNGQVKVFSDIKIGDSVKVKGARDTDDDTLIIAEEIIIFE